MTDDPLQTHATTAKPDFRVGINYWPARTAMGWWSNFDPGEVRDDFARIAGAGFDSTRIFLTWEDFQPTARRIDTVMLDRLVVVADLATEAGLEVMPTLFTGHMSGVNWIPPWALGSSEVEQRFRVVSGGAVSRHELRNWFTDPDVIAAQVLQTHESAVALSGHPALRAWDLGNENSNCVIPPDRASGRAWLDRMTTAIRDADETAAITIGLHMEDLEQNRNLGPAEAAEACDFLTMHGYPIYARWAEHPTDQYLLAFLTEVTRWLGGGADVLFSEFGLPTHRIGDTTPLDAPSMLVEETVAADYTDRALTALRNAGATGAMLWCYSDYDTSIWDEPPLDDATHERSFGLWRADGSPKPAVTVVAPHCGLQTAAGAPDHRWIDIEPHDFYTDKGSHLSRLYRRYRRSISQTT